MEVTVHVPDDIFDSLRIDDTNIERSVLEALALEGVRSGRLTRGQARRLLGFSTRYGLEGFLKDHRVPVEDNFQTVVQDSNSIVSSRR